MKEKLGWTLALLVAVSLFLTGLVTNQYMYYIATIILAFIIRRNGYEVLFKEFDDKQKERRKKSEEIMQKMRDGSKNNGGIL